MGANSSLLETLGDSKEPWTYPQKATWELGKAAVFLLPCLLEEAWLESKMSGDCGMITKTSLPVMYKPRTHPTSGTFFSKTAMLPLPAVAEPEVSVEGQ